jgi:hypothetical protein
VTNIVIPKICLSLILIYLSFFSIINHSAIARIAAGLSVIVITGNDIKSSIFMTRGRPGNVVGIATGYGLDGPWIEYRW